jgi:DNA modification methylase
MPQAGTARKDPKYVTHGLHPYKGKFYPQLAKALINIAGVRPGSRVLDPFCGSGTTLLECYLNGLSAYGCDLHPLAAKIAKAKTGVLSISPTIVSEAILSLSAKLNAEPHDLPVATDQFDGGAIAEILDWFPAPVVAKVNWLLGLIRSVSGATLRDFLEVILSSIVRQVSQQEPTDLRIRRRKEPIQDADVCGLFRLRLDDQYRRLRRFWAVRGYSPFRFLPAHTSAGDARLLSTFSNLGLDEQSVDLVLTSPPYATALPYIDTDRLSLLLLFGMTSQARRPLENAMTGSREITNRERAEWESEITSSCNTELPASSLRLVSSLYKSFAASDVGFRRRNLPALLLRFFTDMQQVLGNCRALLRPGGEALVVIGDNHTSLGGRIVPIQTTRLVEDIAKDVGFEYVERIPITVTTENLVHIHNAITTNVVLRLRRPET